MATDGAELVRAHGAGAGNRAPPGRAGTLAPIEVQGAADSRRGLWLAAPKGAPTALPSALNQAAPSPAAGYFSGSVCP
jgi:hypothetical protein